MKIFNVILYGIMILLTLFVVTKITGLIVQSQFSDLSENVKTFITLIPFFVLSIYLLFRDWKPKPSKRLTVDEFLNKNLFCKDCGKKLAFVVEESGYNTYECFNCKGKK